MSDIMKNVEELIFYGECDDEDNKSKRFVIYILKNYRKNIALNFDKCVSLSSTALDANINLFQFIGWKQNLIYQN